MWRHPIGPWPVAALVGLGCGGKAVVDAPLDGDDGGGGAATSGTVGSTGPSSGAGSGCAHAQPAAGVLCVRGELGPDGVERLDAGTPVRFEVRPAGCFSSSCTAVREASCAVQLGGPANPQDVSLTSTFCLEDLSVQGIACTDDCGGGGRAECEAGPLAEGGYNVTEGPLTVLFTVPMSLPPGGLCTDPF